MSDWEKCVEFHGHVCGGLTIGYKASLYARELLELTRAADEQVVCIAENDACSVDAIQVMLGCSIGKGNLLFHLRGKQAYTFFSRTTGRSVRLVLKPLPEGMTKAESLTWLQGKEPAELFEVKEPTLPLPGRARIFSSHICRRCGESTGDNWIRMVDGEMLCLDCCGSYNRFDI